MLISHPSSTCDVCLEPYGSGSKAPHSISCGHVFCFSCLQSIPGTCPLCRDRFHPVDTRRLHIDTDPSGASKPAHMSPAGQYSEARKLQDSIARIVKDGSSEHHLRALIDQCSTFLKTQDRGQHEDLRVSHRMISYLCDVKSSLKKQTETLARMEADHDALRKDLATEYENAEATERKYQELLQVSRDEKETALAVEKSLRGHYEQLVEQYQAIEKECHTLHEELDELRSRPPHASRSTFIHTSSIDERLNISKDASSMRDDLTRIKSSDKESFYLSPLPEQIRPLPTTLKSFSALPEVDYDSDMEEVNGKLKFPLSRNVELLPIDPLRSATDPLTEPVTRTTASSRIAHPVPISPHAPRVPSGLSLTAPRNYEERRQSTDELFFPGEDTHTGRGSPVRTPSHRTSPSRPTSAATHGSLERHGTPSHDAQQRDRDRSRHSSTASTQPEQLRTQLHDLLETHMSSSSLPNISHFSSANTTQARPSQSRSASFSSQRPFPVSSTSSANRSPTTTTPSPNPHNSTTPATQIISHASSAALALEQERQKAEKERQKDMERRKQLSDGSSSNPLRDTCCTPVGLQRETLNGTSSGLGTSSGPFRDNAHGFGASLSMGNSSNSLRDTTNAYGSFAHRQLAMSLGGGKGKLASVNA